MLSINNVAAKLGLSVHQLRRWELMFGLEIKRGRGQQRQYREEDMSVLERIKELVEQGWPTSQIRPQLEAEGLLTPKLIGAPPAPGNPEVLQEAIIGLRNFSERRFIDLSKQIDELRQLLISVTLKQELSTDRTSPWQPMASEYVPAPKTMPAQEITIGPQISIDPPKSQPLSPPMGTPPTRVNQIPPTPTPSPTSSYSGTASAPPTASSPTASSPAASATSASSEFSQRSMIGGPSSANSESKPTIPDINDAPKPITEALQRSMSTLDSLFKEQRNTPGLSTGQLDSGSSTPQTSSTSSSSSLPAAPGQPVRYSTIPPSPSTPGAAPSGSAAPGAPSTASTTSATSTPAAPGQSSSPQISSTTSASQAPALGAGSSTAWGSNPNNPAVGANPATAAGASSFPSQTGSSSGNDIAASPTSRLGGTASTASTSSTPATESGSNAPKTSWDQAFTATSVDIDAAPSSGLFEDASPSAAPERNPFTTITGTNNNAVDIKPVDSSQPSLMGQTGSANQGFAGYNSPLGPGNQTGPLPAHTSVESFAPEQKEKLIASQSDSTSTDLPHAAEQEPPPVPALPITAGPQVNFGPNVSAPTPQVTPQRVDDNFGLGEVTDQNYLTVLGRALDLIGWSDEQADSFSLKTFGVPHWDELGRSQAEKLVAHLVGLLKDQLTQ
jgi:DNA-binding transcriptional MerR regulator